MRVYHGGDHTCVAEQLLDGADIVTILEQMGGERMPQGMAAGPFGNPGALDRLLD